MNVIEVNAVTSPAEAETQSWWSHIEKCKSSGLSQARYCREQNLKYHTFLYWRKKLSVPCSTSESGADFVEIGCPAESSSSLRIWVGDLCVEVNENFSIPLLSRVVAALRRL